MVERPGYGGHTHTPDQSHQESGCGNAPVGYIRGIRYRAGNSGSLFRRFFPFCEAVHSVLCPGSRTSARYCRYYYQQGNTQKVMIMYKWFAAIVIIYLLGDPQLDYVSWIGLIGDMKDQFLAVILSLVLAPWVVSQFDS